MLGSPSSHNNDVDEFEVDIEALGLGAAITPAMLRFLTGSDAAPAVPASALPQSSSSVSGGSKLQPPPPSTLESSLADGSFEASLEPFQWLVRDVDPHDSSSIPTENDSLLRNLSDFDSRDSSGSSGRVMASTVAPRRAERTRDQPIRQISASSSKPSASAKARTAGEQPAMSLPSTVSMIQAIYKVLASVSLAYIPHNCKLCSG